MTFRVSSPTLGQSSDCSYMSENVDENRLINHINVVMANNLNNQIQLRNIHNNVQVIGNTKSNIICLYT